MHRRVVFALFPGPWNRHCDCRNLPLAHRRNVPDVETQNARTLKKLVQARCFRSDHRIVRSRGTFTGTSHDYDNLHKGCLKISVVSSPANMAAFPFLLRVLPLFPCTCPRGWRFVVHVSSFFHARFHPARLWLASQNDSSESIAD